MWKSIGKSTEQQGNVTKNVGGIDRADIIDFKYVR